MTEKGTPAKTLLNTQWAMHRIGLTYHHDVFRNRMAVSGHLLQEYAGELTDIAVLLVRQFISQALRFEPTSEMTRDALVALCASNPIDPIAEYLDELRWDGVPRVSTFLIEHADAPDNSYVRAVSTIMLVAAVRRVRNPGFKFDTIPVLEGPQGSGKSTALKILAGEQYHSDMDILALDQKAQMEAMEGIWIYEVCELAGMKFADVSKVKAFASRAVDRARPAYGRYVESRPRRGIFVGTTNDDAYLRDETGNRRFLPVKTGRFDLAALSALRDQLWAEAAAREAAGESITLPEELWAVAAQEQASRVPSDPLEDVLADFAGSIRGGRAQASTRDLIEFLQLPNSVLTPGLAKRLGVVMRKLGWDGPKTIVLGDGRRVKGYDRPINLRGGSSII